MGGSFVLTSLKEKGRPAAIIKLYPYVFTGLALITLGVLLLIYSGAVSQPQSITGNRDADGQRLSLEADSGALPESYPDARDTVTVELLQNSEVKGSVQLTQTDGVLMLKADLGGIAYPQNTFAAISTGSCVDPAPEYTFAIPLNKQVSGEIDSDIESLLAIGPLFTLISGDNTILCTDISK